MTEDSGETDQMLRDLLNGLESVVRRLVGFSELASAASGRLVLAFGKYLQSEREAAA